MHRRDARQDVARRRSTCCAPTAPRSSCAPTDVAPESPQSYYRVADRLTAEIPGAFQPNQYRNPANPAAHYGTTGPGDLAPDRRARSPTSSPASAPAARSPASARYLKEQNPDVAGHRRRPGGLDLLRRRRSSPYLVEGVGEDFWPTTFDPRVVDRYVTRVRPRQLPHRRAGSRRRGHAGRRLVRPRRPRRARRSPRDRRPGRDGRRDPARRRARLPQQDLQRRLDEPVRLPRAHERPHRRRRPAAKTAPARSRRSSPSQTHQKVKDAIALLHEHRVSQLPVVSGNDADTVVGSVGERGLLKHAVDDPGMMGAPIVDVMEPPFPAVSDDRPGARGRRAAVRRPPGAARHRATASRPASSPAPTCSSRWSDERS